jgi:hypothetical protein
MYQITNLGISRENEREKATVGLVKSYPLKKIADQKRKTQTKNLIGSSHQ